jgi:hypothetical protein
MMLVHQSVIKESYRAALADWNSRGSQVRGRALIAQTASLASLWTNDEITEASVITVLKSLMSGMGKSPAKNMPAACT